jgi:folate-binding protein YgfZ
MTTRTQVPVTDPWSWQPLPPARLERPVALMRLEGKDSLRFLHGQTSQAVEGAAPGRWLRTCCVSATARMRALAEVLVDEGGAWLVIGDGDAAAVRQALDRVLFPADDVSLGPLLGARWIEATDAAADGDGSLAWSSLGAGGGWRLGSAVVLPEGAPLPPELEGRRPLDDGEAERWRIGRGRPAAPGEIQDDTNPFELGLASRVSLSKGCYLGQETLARLATYDGVKRQLRRWHCPDPDPALGSALAPGCELRAPDGGRAGVVTSVLRLEDGTGWIGLALVRRAALAEPVLATFTAGTAAELRMSEPEEFVAPPVGPGGAQSAPGPTSVPS